MSTNFDTIEYISKNFVNLTEEAKTQLCDIVEEYLVDIDDLLVQLDVKAQVDNKASTKAFYDVLEDKMIRKVQQDIVILKEANGEL